MYSYYGPVYHQSRGFQPVSRQENLSQNVLRFLTLHYARTVRRSLAHILFKESRYKQLNAQSQCAIYT